MTKENITERIKGGGVSTAPKININIPKVGSGGSGGRNNPSTSAMNVSATKTPIRKIDPKQFDNRSAAVTTNTPTGGSLKAGSFGISQAGRDQAAANRAEFNKPKPSTSSSNTSSSSMSARDKFKSKFIKKDKGVGFVRRGSVTARRAENLEKNRMRAKQMAKDRIARKQEAEVKSKSQSNSGGSSQTMTASYTPDMDAYDMVLEYLLSTEQAATIEEANYVMMQLDEENIQEIVGQVAKIITKTPLVKLVPAAAATIATTKFVASKMGQKSGENQIKNSKMQRRVVT